MVERIKKLFRPLLSQKKEMTMEEIADLFLQNELARLKSIPRYTPATTNILGPLIKIVDAASFVFIYQELFIGEIYKFVSDSKSPYILDCGANIGLSVIYFKKLYPDARIIAFEPDEGVAKVFEENVKAFSLKDVELVQRGLWNKETVLSFSSEGADAGRIEQNNSNVDLVEIRTISLKSYLQDRIVDFLKIDIEGAETIVLEDCKDLLRNVKNIFVEYHSFENAPQSLSLIFQILQDAGFRIHITAPGLSSPQPLMERVIYMGMDMQINIYGFRQESNLS